MILNKFSTVSAFCICKGLVLLIFVLTLICCNKSANIYGNKAFISMTHVAYGVGPLTTTLDGDSLFSGTLAFGSTTGNSSNPYDTAVSRISYMFIQENLDTLLSGNQAFQQGRNYSIFVYDTLDKRSVNMIILQDYPPGGLPDTITNVRYLNFSPGTSIGLELVNTRQDNPYSRDTVITSLSPFVGYNPNPSLYLFKQILAGTYQVYAFAESSIPNADSSNFKKLGLLQIDPYVNYNIYLQGFVNDSSAGPNHFQLKSVPLN